MKKILILLSDSGIGGAERQAINFALYLKNNNYDVSVLTLSNYGQVNDLCDNYGINNYTIARGKKRYKIAAVLKNRLIHKKKGYQSDIDALIKEVENFLLKKNFDFCISYCILANMILGNVNRRNLDSKFVWFQRDAGINDDLGIYQKKAITNMDYILCNGSSGAAWLKEKYKVESEIIYNGISLKESNKEKSIIRRELKVPEEYMILTMIANLKKEKDHLTILKALKIVIYEYKYDKVVLLLAGRMDDQYEKLKNYVHDNNLENNVRFLGLVNNIEEILKVTDINVFGAKSEGSPNGIIEPSYVGIPSVATDLPEIREVLSESNYPYLFEKENYEDAAKKIVEMITSNNQRRLIGEMDKKKAQELFSSNINYNQILRIIGCLE